MKFRPHLFVLVAGLLAPAPLSAATPPEPTATDLARHLGVHLWKFSKADLPTDFSVSLLEIKNGKVTRSCVTFSSSTPGDLVIAMHYREDGKLAASISIGGSSTKSLIVTEKHQGVSSGGKPIIDQPIILLSSYPRSDSGSTTATGRIEDLTSGIALQITPLDKSSLSKNTVANIEAPPSATSTGSPEQPQPSNQMTTPLAVPDYRFHDLQPVITVDDVDSTVAYYRDKLGFKIDFVVGEPGIHARVSKDQIMLQFATRRADAKDLTDGHYIHLGHVDGREDLDGLYKEYVEKGVKITMEPTIQSWGLREFEIEDLNGKRFRFAVDAPKQ